MDKLKIQLVRATLDSIREALDAAKAQQKKETGHVSSHMAAEFNQLIDDVAALNADVASSLPKKIDPEIGPFKMIGATSISYVEFDSYVRRIDKILTILEQP